ncbi:copper-binding protein [Photobacterium ganghwense]|uniref:Copper-binding protein n=1 Tax=Photobacterium ganghwense TaxID=320778 RepID=A0A0J1GXF0_9GAMM|nr:copper-binding protein [Photobacterium ganghwense]KLV04321.1 copper-binding protein [Photobacterium ganghwense]PSU08052.1 copper-binding protein [Photobacterium ganghwense]
MTSTKLLSLAFLLAAGNALAAGGHHDMSNMNGMSDHGMAGHDMAGHGQMASSVGMPAPAAQASKTYQVILTDDMKMRFEPALSLKQGDVVNFMVKNEGKIPHEFSIGSLDEQAKHRDMMREMPNMEHHDGTTVTLAPGESAEMGWNFMGERFVEFSCNIPGHSEAGMKRNTVLK